MTPRQIAAWLELGMVRHHAERAALIADVALAAQGKREDIQRVIRELESA